MAVLFGILSGVVGAFGIPVLGQVLGLVGGLLALYGTWLLTEPDPSGIGEDRYANSRKVIRLALLVGLPLGSAVLLPAALLALLELWQECALRRRRARLAGK